MAELQTRPNDDGIEVFLASVKPANRAGDARIVMSMMADATGAPARMWGASIIGFGSYRYSYSNGSEKEWMLIGLSPRKTALTLYIMPGFSEFDTLMSRLGKFKTGKSCLYINRLKDIDQAVLRDLIGKSVDWMRAKYSTT